MPLQSINTPTSGLRTAQRNLATAGHNMANVGNNTFTRQRINQGTFGYQAIGRSGANLNQVGLGVDIVGVQQIRNQFLDIQFRSEIGRANFYDRLHRAGSDLEISLGEFTNTSSGVAVTRGLWTSLQELSMNPSGIAGRANFISSASAYIGRMNDNHRRLMEQKNVLNGEVKTMVNDINDLLDTINTLNAKIAREETFGQSANDLRDSRNHAMDQLASKLDVNFRTSPITGHIEVTTNGVHLLSNGVVQQVGLRYTEEGSNFVEPVVGGGIGRPLPFDPSFRNATSILRLDRPPVTSDRYSIDRPGALMGLVMARGLTQTTHVSQYATFPRYNAAGVADSSGMFIRTGGQLLQLNTEEMQRAQFEWQSRNDFNSNHAIIPRTMRQLDAMFNNTVAMINEFLTYTQAQSGRIADGPPPVYAQSAWGRDTTSRDNNPTVNLRGEPGIPIFVVSDPNRINTSHLDTSNPNWPNTYTLQFTLGNVVLNPKLQTAEGFNDIGLRTTYIDTDETSVLMNLFDAWQTEMFSLDGSARMGLDDFYNQLVLNLGLEVERLGNASIGQGEVAQSLEGRRRSTSGVSLEEEMTNMLLFQHSFNAASRLITVIDEMILTVINI